MSWPTFWECIEAIKADDHHKKCQTCAYNFARLIQSHHEELAEARLDEAKRAYDTAYGATGIHVLLAELALRERTLGGRQHIKPLTGTCVLKKHKDCEFPFVACSCPCHLEEKR